MHNIPEDAFELLVVSAAHIKAVPGRKTDVRDAEWIADLLSHGLLRASFVPPRPERELRELTRYRSALTWERTSEVDRVAARRGAKRAVMAVGQSMIVIANAILARSTTFTDLGSNYSDEGGRDQVWRRLKRRLETLGYQVSVSPVG